MVYFIRLRLTFTKKIPKNIRRLQNWSNDCTRLSVFILFCLLSSYFF